MNLITPEERTIREQRVRIEFLEEENRQIRKAMVPVANYPREWNLTPAQQRAIAAFVAAEGGFLTTPQLLIAMSMHTHRARQGAAAANLIKVHMCSLRKRLQPIGIEIATRWGSGYEMTADSVALVKRSIEQRAAA